MGTSLASNGSFLVQVAAHAAPRGATPAPRVTNESATVPRCPEPMRFQRVPSHRSLLLSTEDMCPAMRYIAMPLVCGVRDRIGRMDDCHRGSRFLDHCAPASRELIVGGQ